MTDRFPHDSEPDGDVSLPHHFWIGIAVSAFAFGFVWPTYPETGAALSLIGLGVAADDLIEHAFGIPTPLDQIWRRWIRPIIRRIENR